MKHCFGLFKSALTCFARNHLVSQWACMSPARATAVPGVLVCVCRPESTTGRKTHFSLSTPQWGKLNDRQSRVQQTHRASKARYVLIEYHRCWRLRQEQRRQQQRRLHQHHQHRQPVELHGTGSGRGGRGSSHHWSGVRSSISSPCRIAQSYSSGPTCIHAHV